MASAARTARGACVPMMQCAQCVEPQELAYVPLGQAVHAGARRAGAKLPGAHMRQSGASTPVVAQPAGHAAHQADCPGGLGQPAQRACQPCL